MQPLHHDPATELAERQRGNKGEGGSQNKYCRVYPFVSLNCRHSHTPRGSWSVSLRQVVALRIEPSVTALSGPSGQPVLDYRISRALRSRTENLLLPKQ